MGSLVETTKGYFFISTGWGRIQIQDENYFVISIESPIGRLLKNKKREIAFSLGYTAYDIINVS